MLILKGLMRVILSLKGQLLHLDTPEIDKDIILIFVCVTVI